MPDTTKLIVKNIILPKRIDAYLADVYSNEYSRQDIKKLLDRDLIFLNGKKAKPKDLVRSGDAIEGVFDSEKKNALLGEDIPVAVLYEDDSLMVVNKPAGLVVHPGAGNPTGTLVNALVGRGTILSNVGEAGRPGIVHRIDKETSGILLVAKNNVAHRKLQAQFAARSLSKTYLALVWGRMDYEQGHIQAPIDRDSKVRQKMSVCREGSGREALTQYRVIKRFRGASLVELKLITGRTHQIRVHMKHLGHSVVGDRLYGGPPDLKQPRLALHAWKIEFTHPKTGKIFNFEAPIPKAIESMIDAAEKGVWDKK